MAKKLYKTKMRKMNKDNKKTMNKDNKKKTPTNMAYINPTVSIMAFTVNGLNKPIKIYIVRLNKKQDLTICYLQETHFKCKDSD